MARPRAHSSPEEPPPHTSTFLPVITRLRSTSVSMAADSMPGILGRRYFEPVATMTASGASSSASSGVTGVFSRMSAPQFMAASTSQRRYSFMYPLQAGAAASMSRPPSWPDASHKITSCPRFRRVRAA